MSSPVILRSSAASAPRWRNCGGGRRAAQIGGILAAAGIEVKWIADSPAPRFSRLALLRAACRLRFTAPAIPTRLDRNLIRYLAGDYLQHRWYFDRHPEIRVFLVEDCIDYARLRAAHDAGVATVCLPMNFETWQQPAQADFYSGEPMPGSLHREAAFIARGDAAFCISREEQWFLANYGARSDYLPYFPPTSDHDRLAAIRRQRAAQPPAGHEFFSVTAVSNLRNREGLLALAQQVQALPDSVNFHLHVGGYGVNDLREAFPRHRCTVHGELDDAALDALMVRCKGSIISQAMGAGALTRIPELLCAGVPVLATPHAARSRHQTPGVHLFHNAAELAAYAQAELPLPPAPVPDRAAELRLIAVIRELAARPQPARAPGA